MSSYFWQRFSIGQTYMKIWPMRKELTPLFPENRVIRATEFAIKVMPPIAVISVLIQVAFHNQLGFSSATIMALFALGIPLQGLWWLGTRSLTPLIPAHQNWYHEINHQMKVAGIAQEVQSNQLTYQDLAKLLKRAFKHLDRSDFERWF